MDKPEAKPEERQQPILLIEEDDEFEEFEKDGKRHSDWEQVQEGQAETKEWEEDWDDDVEEEEFTAELRNELLKVK